MTLKYFLSGKALQILKDKKKTQTPTGQHV